VKKSKYCLICLIIALLVLIIVPFLIPTQRYVDEARSLASSKLGAAVIIGGLNFGLLPTPRLVLKDIIVGKNDDLKVKRLVFIATLSSLFSSGKIIKLKIEQTVIKDQLSV